MRKFKEFTEEEVELIKKYYPVKDGVNKLVEITGRSRQSIHSKGKRLGLNCYGERNVENKKTAAERQMEYEKRTGYNKDKTVMFGVRCVYGKEDDIIDKLNSVPNKAGYIKELIRADIEKNGKYVDTMKP